MTETNFLPEERGLRRNLAAAYRLIALFGWDDHVATHLSARLPDGSYLLNPFGLMFEEITASSLIRVDMEGNVISPPDVSLNVAGYTVHSGVLGARDDIHCAIHLHTHDGVAVSALEEGFLPLSQTALLIHSDIAYHEFEGVVAQKDERERLGRDLGAKNLMILRNHGTLAVGETIADAFYRIYTLEWCCTTQMRALASGHALRLPDIEAAKQVGSAMDWTSPQRFSLRVFWPAMLRKAERCCPGFDD
ncbi:class II aldolase/adducin family protein [Parasphingorhabdus sp.]|uniref:class II aldolase/adducin family protein n=1 Tax=Parasphingorhabdus sp. TaxID=2709688 RepID=UPI003A909BD7